MAHPQRIIVHDTDGHVLYDAIGYGLSPLWREQWLSCSSPERVPPMTASRGITQEQLDAELMDIRKSIASRLARQKVMRDRANQISDQLDHPHIPLGVRY